MANSIEAYGSFLLGFIGLLVYVNEASFTAVGAFRPVSIAIRVRLRGAITQKVKTRSNNEPAAGPGV